MDDVTCFSLILEAVVLALTLQLGMDPGTYQALRAIYKQLRSGLGRPCECHKCRPNPSLCLEQHVQ